MAQTQDEIKSEHGTLASIQKWNGYSMAQTNNHTFAEIAELDATGQTREIYDDFNSSIGLPTITLIYRHMATTPGCLEWAWALLRPNFVSGTFAREAEHLVAGLALVKSWLITRNGLLDAGVDEAVQIIIIQTLEAYNLANPMNLIALMVLQCEIEGRAPVYSDAPLEKSSMPRRLTNDLPPMADLGALPKQTLNLLRTLATQAGVGGAPVIPSFFRHLTEWPGYLKIVASAVARLVDDGSLDREASALQEEAYKAACRIPRHSSIVPPPSASQRYNLLGLIDLFPTLIARMIVIGIQLRRSLPT